MSAGSYDFRAEHRDPESEFRRLEAQALLSWEQEAQLLNRLGLRDRMSVLELGSGPGFVTERLLSLVPGGTVTAVELDAELSQLAERRLAGVGGERLRSVRASILETGLPAESFDFAVARLVFQHLEAPSDAAREALRVLRPGGKLAVVEVDAALWGIVEPFTAGLQTIYERVARAQATRGGDRLIGRRLWRILKAAGYTNLRLEAFVYHSDELGIEPFAPQLDPDRLLPQVAEGLITLTEFAAVRAAYERFLASPDAYIMMLGFIACGEKAAAPTDVISGWHAPDARA